jgi:hypothetical protein
MHDPKNTIKTASSRQREKASGRLTSVACISRASSWVIWLCGFLEISSNFVSKFICRIARLCAVAKVQSISDALLFFYDQGELTCRSSPHRPCARQLALRLCYDGDVFGCDALADLGRAFEFANRREIETHTYITVEQNSGLYSEF